LIIMNAEFRIQYYQLATADMGEKCKM